MINATLFRAEYKDKHESEIYQFGAATETVVNNAAEAKIDGLEVEAQLAATDRVQLRMSVGWINGKYKEFLAPDRIACQGISRANCPKTDRSDDFAFGFQPDWNVSAGLAVTQPLADGWGRLIGLANYSWADKTVGNFGQPDPLGLGRNEFPDRGEWDFTVIWDRTPFKVAGYVKDAFHDDNFLATSVDVGVFWFGAVSVGPHVGHRVDLRDIAPIQLTAFIDRLNHGLGRAVAWLTLAMAVAVAAIRPAALRLRPEHHPHSGSGELRARFWC